MLSYQHGYHAGNLADLQKHALLAWMLNYLTRKDKPLSYIETHAGRGIYDLAAPEALRTGEAAQGIGRWEGAFPPGHPYRQALDITRKTYGPSAYCGSPLIAATLLRPMDRLVLAELHPQEHATLAKTLKAQNISVRKQDGFELASSICPPEPRRGLMLVDPSWELKEDYLRVPKFLNEINRKWNVGVLCLWYPLLTSGAHVKMLESLEKSHPDALRHELTFPPVREGHRMIGTGLFVINPPWGLSDAAHYISNILESLD